MLVGIAVRIDTKQASVTHRHGVPGHWHCQQPICGEKQFVSHQRRECKTTYAKKMFPKEATQCRFSSWRHASFPREVFPLEAVFNFHIVEKPISGIVDREIVENNRLMSYIMSFPFDVSVVICCKLDLADQMRVFGNVDSASRERGLSIACLSSSRMRAASMVGISRVSLGN